MKRQKEQLFLNETTNSCAKAIWFSCQLLEQENIGIMV